MKRSFVNNIMKEADAFMSSFGVNLPPFAYWSVSQFQKEQHAADGIVDAGLGWDITDYGMGDFNQTGLFLFTLRNGSLDELKAGAGMVYAEKLLISRREQISPMHRHIHKVEDIINRGGSTLAIEVFASDGAGNLCRKTKVELLSDGMKLRVNPGEVIKLAPGQSVTLRPHIWHKFWGEDGDVLIGEVSSVNDDKHDNIFYEPLGRFATIKEDEAPNHLLVSDYPNFLAKSA